MTQVFLENCKALGSDSFHSILQVFHLLPRHLCASIAQPEAQCSLSLTNLRVYADLAHRCAQVPSGAHCATAGDPACSPQHGAGRGNSILYDTYVLYCSSQHLVLFFCAKSHKSSAMSPVVSRGRSWLFSEMSGKESGCSSSEEDLIDVETDETATSSSPKYSPISSKTLPQVRRFSWEDNKENIDPTQKPTVRTLTIRGLGCGFTSLYFTVRW